jgi:hypothetical protein
MDEQRISEQSTVTSAESRQRFEPGTSRIRIKGSKELSPLQIVYLMNIVATEML